MKNSQRTLSIVLTLLVAATLSGLIGCKKKPPTTTEQARPAEVQPTPTPVPPPAPTPVVQPDVLSQDLDTLNRKGYLQDAFYDFDRSELREDARAALSADAQWLSKYPSIQILIEGHCDERGTSKYNLALGDRRANVPKEYLGSLGINTSRIKTISYGKERPFCTESNETCWQQNRRAHFVITAK